MRQLAEPRDWHEGFSDDEPLDLDSLESLYEEEPVSMVQIVELKGDGHASE